MTDLTPWGDITAGLLDPHHYCWWRASAWAGRVGGDDSRNRNGNLPDALFDALAARRPESRLLWNGGPSNWHLGFPTQVVATTVLSDLVLSLARSAPALPPGQPAPGS